MKLKIKSRFLVLIAYCLLFSVDLFSQTMVEIKLPATGYAARLVGKTGTATAGDTVSGTYTSGLNKHTFYITESGEYKAQVDAAGGTSFTDYSAWNGSNGYRRIYAGMTGADESLVQGQIQDSVKFGKNIINVWEYGANPYDTADDAEAIETALRAGEGSTVIINAGTGTFYFSRNQGLQILVTDVDNMTIIINGNIKLGDNISQDGRTVYMFSFKDCDNLKIKGGKIDGNWDNQSGWTGGWDIGAGNVITAQQTSQSSCDNIEIIGVDIQDFNGQGIILSNYNGVKMSACYLDSLAEGTNFVSCNGVTMEHNQVGTMLDEDGLEVSTCTNVLYNHNRYFGTYGQHACEPFNSSDMKILNEEIVQEKQNSINCSALGDNVEIAGCKIKSQVYLVGSGHTFPENIWIHNNLIVDSTSTSGAAVQLYSYNSTANNNFRFEDNTIETTRQYGITLDGQNRGAQIKNNTIKYIGSSGGTRGVNLNWYQSATYAPRDIDLLANKIYDFSNGIWIHVVPDSVTIGKNRFWGVTNRIYNNTSSNLYDYIDFFDNGELFNYGNQSNATFDTKFTDVSTAGTLTLTANSKNYNITGCTANIDSISVGVLPEGAEIRIVPDYSYDGYYLKDDPPLYLAGDWQVIRDNLIVLQQRERYDGTMSWFEVSRSANYGTGSTSSDVIAQWEADVGITLNGSNVSNWEGQENGYNLSQSNASYQPSYGNDSLLFATDDYLVNSTPAFYNFASSIDYTIEAYFRTGSNVTSLERILYSWNSDSSATPGIMYITGGYVRFYWKSKNDAGHTCSRAVSTNTTYYVCVTVDRDALITITLDASSSATTDISASNGDEFNMNSSWPFYIGTDKEIDDFFNGTIYEVRLSSKILSGSEISNRYSELQGKY